MRLNADETPRREALAHYDALADEHWRLGLACADLGLWDAWARHGAALDRVLRARGREAVECARWSEVVPREG